ncbi:MAG TPA: 3-isopropylmalate dehydrogenase [Candidatus Acidoferrales bacterium]|nr:3-isopropylmalate dehydrogenase [Candidatus Acidoferrales bacterium]
MSATSETKRIAVIPGDGIGKEVTPEGVKVLEAVCSAAGRHLTFTQFDWGTDRFLRDGTTLPPNAIEMLHRDFDAILFGAMGDPRVPSNQPAMEILLGLRFKLDLYVNARPCVLLDKRLTPLRDRVQRDINFMILRENTEGAYAGIGGVFKQGTPDEIAIQEDLNTRKGVERIIRYAFEYARKKGLKRLCMSDKSNAMQFGHGLWQRVWAELRKEYADIETRHLFVDTLMMEMVRDPAQFDVIVTCNMFGDIASDLGAQLSGGLGLAASGNIHPGRVSLFEPVHGSAPNIAGKGIANPLGSILTAAMMLDYLGWQRESEAMNAAVQAAVREGKTTPDLGGTMDTRAVGDWVAERIAKQGFAGARA